MELIVIPTPMDHLRAFAIVFALGALSAAAAIVGRGFNSCPRKVGSDRTVGGSK